MSVTPKAPEHSVANSPQVEARRTVEPQRWLTIILNAIPNLVAFSCLGGVMYVGHHNGWKLPKTSELWGTATVAADDWCSEHLVAESQCIECRAELLPKGKPFGFCREHGVAECVIHHPELAQTRANPQLPKYDTAQAIALIARPENNSRNTLHTHRIQFTSAESVTKAGVDVDVVTERPMADSIRANGEMVFDPTRVAHLSSKTPGSVAFVFKTIGDQVAPGEILALVDSAQLGQTKTQLTQAVVQYQLRRTIADRLRPLGGSGAISQRSVIDAESAFQEAEIAVVSARQSLANLGFDVPDRLEAMEPTKVADELRFLGIPSSVIATLSPGTKTANLIPVRAQYDGVVVASEVVAGEVVDPSRTLFTVADPSRMWLLLNVRQEDAEHVHRGLPVRFRADNRNQEVEGKVDWISPAVDQQTRTTQVRVVIRNSDGRFQDKTFGTGQIILREESKAIVVPGDAVQSTPDAHFVFVRDKRYFDEGSPKFFHVRQVRIGARDDQFVELLAGVLPGEVVATKGSNVLLAHLLRSSLGAGCGCHEH